LEKKTTYVQNNFSPNFSHIKIHTHAHLQTNDFEIHLLNNPQRVFSVNLGRSVSKYQADLQFFPAAVSGEI
jgi:hypothetical protein